MDDNMTLKEDIHEHLNGAMYHLNRLSDLLYDVEPLLYCASETQLDVYRAFVCVIHDYFRCDDMYNNDILSNEEFEDMFDEAFYDKYLNTIRLHTCYCQHEKVSGEQNVD
tara:strand:+ start:53 stop:382 length:330 start_codon:yes stop_codon:yes gene_type:complete